MASSTRLQRPGFGLPINREGEDGRFEHAISDWFATTGVTLREKAMLDFVNQITDKPRWWEKVHNEEIVANWRSECGSNEQQKYDASCLDQKCFDYCVAELRDKASRYGSHGIVSVLDVMASVIKGDQDAASGFCDELRRAVEPLENVRDNFKDWHPGSDGLVLDLVHPSLFPLEYGTTKVLPSDTVPKDGCAAFAGMGEVCPALPAEPKDQRAPGRANLSGLDPFGSYQWLPTDISFHECKAASIDGYINNLHPVHNEELYPVLTKAVERAVPLWNECLNVTAHREQLRIRVDQCSYEDFERPAHIDADEWPHKDWIYDHPDELQLIQPTVHADYIPLAQRQEDQEPSPVDLIKQFPNGVQVIFKLANIHLTPEKPTYSGSNWHVEGALNEHICATALFYHDQENIQDSYIEFRQLMDCEEMMMKPAQNEYEAAERMFGVENEGIPLQHLGRVLTRTGRIVAFPNVLQHRVTPFSLRDPSKPGHRKILAMFLVDPHIRVLSTSNVPPQRLDWWAEEVRKVSPFSELPVELFDQIVDEVEDFPIDWERACEVRQALMAERGGMNDELDELWQEDTFFFCEH